MDAKSKTEEALAKWTQEDKEKFCRRLIYYMKIIWTEEDMTKFYKKYRRENKWNPNLKS